ncbi:contractile injection system tape measure protein [Mucilaginibacter sp.]|uniref:contractile injection system tape measure protein n=1 Tax=Mucilaginibacter sp. TaxID=1882438 RepID=UPI0026010888|nr:contractile injection system tape measure protein [Mucilaginibacter sp.]
MITRDKPYQPVNKNSMPVHNAGCVLIHSYFPMLFERLGLMVNQSFVNEDARQKAVHYLQYVITGLSHTEEHILPLNKVLCEVPVEQHIIDGILVLEEHAELINGMIKAIIGYWPAIGTSSIEGFRGNWLVRDGLLTEFDDRWELAVEKRAYDVLIHKSPFTFSVIKHPWMDKPVHVSWPN